jgi:hypothetical protein
MNVGAPAAPAWVAVHPLGEAPADASGNIYMTNVYPFAGGYSSSGAYLVSFGSPGSGNGEFNALFGIVVA